MARVNDKTKADTRRALLAAGAQAFARHGYERASIDAVSSAAGLAKGTIYNYFSSKEELFHTLLGEACELAAASADAAPASAPTRERLQAFVAGNLRWARRRRPLAEMFARELLAGDAATRDFLLRAAAPCVEKVAGILGDGRARGELSSDTPPEVLALTFIALANMLLLQGWQGPLGWPAAGQLPEVAAQLFLGGLGAGTPVDGAAPARR